MKKDNLPKLLLLAQADLLVAI
jgi:hypothetical protein